MQHMNWIRITEQQPPVATRVLLSDGNIQTVGTHIESDHVRTWFLDTELVGFEPTWWQPLPQTPPEVRILSQNTVAS